MIKKILLSVFLYLGLMTSSFAFQWDMLCSGFFISNTGLIGTAAHCYSKDYNYYIQYRNKEYPVTFVSVDQKHDAALVQSPLVGNNFLLLSQLNYTGEHIYLYGYPIPDLAGYAGRVQQGNITTNTEEKIFIKLNTGVSCAGNSGGPVVNDQGQVIGILVEGEEGDDNVLPCSYYMLATRIFYLEQLVHHLHLKNTIFTYTRAGLPINSDEVIILYGRHK
jgi:S1-C subfamily serine protease